MAAGPESSSEVREPVAPRNTCRRTRVKRSIVFMAALWVLAGVTTLDSSMAATASIGVLHPSEATIGSFINTVKGNPGAALPSQGATTQKSSAVSSNSTPNGQLHAVVVNPSRTLGGPVVTSIAPTSVSAGGGTTVTIKGQNFTPGSTVYFGPNVSSQVSVKSSTLISATAPTNSGTVHVDVVTGVGTSADSRANQLTYASTGQLPITTFGQDLELGGVPTKFTGVNAYEIATAWGTNAGCGGMDTPTQIASLFSSLAPNSMVRFWAFQGTMATDVTTHQIDWAPIDEVFYLAATYHVYLVPAITDQSGTCDGEHWQDPSWYAGGYRDVFNSATGFYGAGLDPLSYGTYMQELVNRYKNSPALGMWEPISEAEVSSCAAAYQPTNCGGHQSCPDESEAAADLTSFFTAVGAEIHALDGKHLVEAGFLGGGQCGTAGADYQVVGASPGIDVLSVHDYYGSTPLGGDQWNGLAVRFAQAAFLDKPIITGEVGISAGNVPGCESFAQRQADMVAKMTAQFAADSSAFLVWDWGLDPLGPCSYSTGPGDPLMDLMAGGR
jgi:mannan endo-1,4-beta-mannosidase